MESRRASIGELQPKADAVGPEVGAVELRRRSCGADQCARAEDRALRRIDVAVDLVARPDDLAPVHEVVTDRGEEPFGYPVADLELDGRDDREAAAIGAADVRRLREE